MNNLESVSNCSYYCIGNFKSVSNCSYDCSVYKSVVSGSDLTNLIESIAYDLGITNVRELCDIITSDNTIVRDTIQDVYITNDVLEIDRAYLAVKYELIKIVNKLNDDMNIKGAK